MSWAANIEKEQRFLQIFGNQGGIYFDQDQISYYGQKAGSIINLAPYSDPQIAKNTTKLVRDGAIGMYQEFARAIQTGMQPIASGREGLRVSRIIDALYRSAREGKEIRLD